MTESERKRVKLATFALIFLILGGLASLMPTVQTQDPPILPVPPSPVPVNQTVPLEGNMTFTFYPDESIKMKVIGSIEQAIEPYSAPPPVYNAYLNLASSPSGVNLTDVTGTFVLKLTPMFSMLLATLELDIETHNEGLRGNTTILFNMPGYFGVNGSTGAFTDESTGENNLDFDLTITIWYAVIPKEEIQGFIETFPTLESQIVTQISELTEGNITIQDLTYSSEIGFASATITIAGNLVGDFVKGGTALSTNLLPLLGLEEPEMTPLISPEDLMYTKAKSADIHIWYDRDEFAFLMDSEGVIEGDLDRQFNVMKDIYLEQLLQLPDIPPEWALMINDVLLPTNISRDNLGMTFEYLFDGENIKLDFVVDGLVFRPPTTEAFLTFLDKVFAGGSFPSFSLIFEGGSDEDRFVEIEVPPATSEPVLAFPMRVVWIVDNLTNLNLVTFKVREGPTPPPLPPFLSNLTITPEEIEEGEKVTISLDIMNPNKRSITYEFDMKIENIPPPTWPPNDLILLILGELEAYESKTVSRTIPMYTVGDFKVTADGMTGSFKVGTWPPKPPPKPAEFVVSDLTITPEEAELWEGIDDWTFRITANVTNIGEQEGTHTVDLKVDGFVRARATLDLGGGVSFPIIFVVTEGVGSYNVEVDGLTGSFTVKVPLKPAELVFSNLEITPKEVELGKSVTISVEVTNVGEEMGGCTVELKINGEVVDSVELAAFGGIPPDYDQVTATQFFELTMDEGTYEVEVEGLTETFTVVIPESPFWERTEVVIAVVVGIGIIAILWRRVVLKT